MSSKVAAYCRGFAVENSRGNTLYYSKKIEKNRQTTEIIKQVLYDRIVESTKVMMNLGVRMTTRRKMDSVQNINKVSNKL